MNLFQIMAVSGLAVIVIVEWARLYRHQSGVLGVFLRSMIWLSAIGFILYPDALTYVARWLGIGVGANLLLYLLTLAFIAVSFLLYARTVQLRRQMTVLVRHLALSHPLPPASQQKVHS